MGDWRFFCVISVETNQNDNESKKVYFIPVAFMFAFSNLCETKDDQTADGMASPHEESKLYL